MLATASVLRLRQVRCLLLLRVKRRTAQRAHCVGVGRLALTANGRTSVDERLKVWLEAILASCVGTRHAPDPFALVKIFDANGALAIVHLGIKCRRPWASTKRAVYAARTAMRKRVWPLVGGRINGRLQ